MDAGEGLHRSCGAALPSTGLMRWYPDFHPVQIGPDENLATEA
jgi:hypothetical protein